MKTAVSMNSGRTKLLPSQGRHLRMTKSLARARAVGDPKAPKFDGVAFLRSLKK
ncbi:MAG: hypothetical protein ACYDH9_04725 [Limisphaerales bacterium]